MKIHIKHYRITCIIGVNAGERVTPQDIFIDLVLGLNLDRTPFLDNIESTIDYGDPARLCQDLAEKNGFHLLESFAKASLELLFEKFPALISAKIIVKKPLAIKGAEYAAVEWEKTRPDNRRS